MKPRCSWVGTDPLYLQYHDTEWGTPVHDDRKLFEFLILEGAQAGLSWITILKKRENYRKAFHNFDPHRIAAYDDIQIKNLLSDKGIIRNKRKIESAVKNAKAFLAVQKEFGSFDAYIWRFVEGCPINSGRQTQDEVPTKTRESLLMSRDLKQRGFQFVGPTICYAFMQAIGMVNDHVVECYRYYEIQSQQIPKNKE
ncbi:MAG: DNA-3-methyladenine glycosylase I [Desulfobacterales bacterium]|nr:DNA-3-methyladenine glycosylase I [Desulfobacterales bacterium]